jgi:zinc and cadmium transporter
LAPPLDLPILLLVLAAGAFAGGSLPLFTRWTRDRLSMVLCFGSGVLLAVIFLEMLPTVWRLAGSWGGLPLLAGFLFTSLLETGLHAHRHEEEHLVRDRAVTVGLSVHSLMDGLVLGTGLSTPELGPALFFAILVHKAPDAFALSTVLLAAGSPRRRILRVQAMFSLATPVGALLAWSLLRGLPEFVLGVAVAGAAGTLLGVATEDLLPEVHRRGREGFLAATLALLGGVALIALYRFLLRGE